MKRLILALLTSLLLLPIGGYAQTGTSGITGVRGITGVKGVAGVNAKNSISSERVIPQHISALATMYSGNYPELVLVRSGSLWARILTLGLFGGNEYISLPMAPGVRIRDTNNRFITHGRLPEFNGYPVAVRLNDDSQVIEIWILTAGERNQLAGRIGYWQ